MNSFTEAERGQAIMVGAVFIFGFLIIGLTIYQVQIIPNQNKQIEFQHHQAVRHDMSQLRAGVLTMSTRSGRSAVTVKLGTMYPPRVFAVNPSSPSGSLSSAASGDIEINLRTGSITASELCGGAETRGVRYAPSYNVFDGADIVYGNAQLYLQQDDGSVVGLETRTIVDDDEVNIYRLAGDPPARGGISSVTVELVGTGTWGADKSTNIKNITIPSALNATQWNDLGLVSSGANVTVTDVSGGVRLKSFPDDNTYTIRCYAVGVDGTAPAEPDPALQEGGGSGGSGGSGGGVGQGDESTYPDTSTATITNSGGIWDNITNVSDINLTNPHFAATGSSDGQLAKDKRYLRLGVELNNASVSSNDYTKYIFVIGDKEGLSYQVKKNGIQWQRQKVTLIKEQAGSQPEKLFEQELDKKALDDWLLNDEPLPLLDNSTYKQPNQVDEHIGEIKNFLKDDDPRELFVVEMHGRVTVELD